ncbi:HNH endonuclease signature motif containing protein [Streptomyces sp. NPDC020807]|uniref:HNH endonuclease signature motif containing protein n=1 Tax=Streptomyces sp. NPDC020807 TaxID=3155119 RepID=UPI0033D4703E
MGTSPYTKERLDAAARGARTLTEALERLGVDPRSGSRRYLHDRMRKLGVDTSHFEAEGTRWTRDVLAQAVAASTNMCEVLRRLGVEVVGGQHTHISRRVKAYGIDTSHFHAPSRRGEPRRSRTPEGLLVEQTGSWSRRIPSDRLTWAMSQSGLRRQCGACGNEGVWRGRPLPLEVDHIDGDWRNNRIENLRFLCPNCHSATDNYRGRGRRRTS